MDRPVTQTLGTQDRVLEGLGQVAIVIGASLFVALCARVTLPLPFTPVPLTLQNFGVLLVGLSLGSRRGFMALVLYLAEGLMGMPVFSPAGPGGIAQLLGPTGGFLLAYPFVAGIAGWVFEEKAGRRGEKGFALAFTACVLAVRNSFEREDTSIDKPAYLAVLCLCHGVLWRRTIAGFLMRCRFDVVHRLGRHGERQAQARCR